MKPIYQAYLRRKNRDERNWEKERYEHNQFLKKLWDIMVNDPNFITIFSMVFKDLLNSHQPPLDNSFKVSDKQAAARILDNEIVVETGKEIHEVHNVFKVIPVAGDGHCFFYALYEGLNGLSEDNLNAITARLQHLIPTEAERNIFDPHVLRVLMIEYMNIDPEALAATNRQSSTVENGWSIEEYNTRMQGINDKSS